MNSEFRENKTFIETLSTGSGIHLKQKPLRQNMIKCLIILFIASFSNVIYNHNNGYDTIESDMLLLGHTNYRQ